SGGDSRFDRIGAQADGDERKQVCIVAEAELESVFGASSFEDDVDVVGLSPRDDGVRDANRAQPAILVNGKWQSSYEKISAAGNTGVCRQSIAEAAVTSTVSGQVESDPVVGVDRAPTAKVGGTNLEQGIGWTGA